MAFDQWDVALSPFPFLDEPAAKLRPILVLSSGAFNNEHGLIVGAMITTASAGLWPSDYALTDLVHAGLRRPCVVRWKIFTLTIASVVRRIGAAGETDRRHLAARLGTILPSA